MKKLIMFLCAMTLVLGMVGIASAAIIFTDDFERGPQNAVGGGWSEIERDADDVATIIRAIPTNTVAITGAGRSLRLRDGRVTDGSPVDTEADATIYSTTGLDLTMFNNMFLSFEWAGDDESESDDKLNVSYSILGGDNPGEWNTLWTIFMPELGSDFASVSGLALPSSVDNESDFKLAFWFDAAGGGGTLDAAYIDNIELTGEPIPVPSTIALLGIGLVGLAGGAVRKKFKKKELVKH
jgi:hypothetical protein